MRRLQQTDQLGCTGSFARLVSPEWGLIRAVLVCFVLMPSLSIVRGQEDSPAHLPPLPAPGRNYSPPAREFRAPPDVLGANTVNAGDAAGAPFAGRPQIGAAIGSAPAWSALVESVVKEALPHDYENRKHWGMTRKTFSGVNVRNDGLKVRISKRTREIRHGNWRRYHIELPNPERNFSFDIQRIANPEPGLYTFEVAVTSKVRITTHFEQWTLGIKGINLSTVSHATLRARLFCQLQLRHEKVPGRLLPDLVIEPKVRQARLALSDLDVHHIGKIGGDLAELMGDSSRWMVEDLLQGQEEKIVTKANKTIEKKRDKLRLSTGKLW